ncbi:competence/damage-inducible protein A [Acetobacterium malicum]|uniref:Putative competence-damage inducible protein n=1 Tax=Acetobacterium malicum TaxID=52692 RepID=A0ABR6YWE2_9FIRM|nr:competence/damage-inducible protein A [Acetobacterium malicum]MBC3899522.1 competence/damage-inducible protein A [Acetobacterium malicum]
MKCELISVGTELLVGDTLNTNVQFLSRELSLLGIPVYFHTTVGDNPKRLEEAVRIAFNRSDLIITTGGLGPTQDDLTKEVIAELFKKKLIQDEKTKEDLLQYFVNREFTMTPNNLKQTFIPESAEILFNPCGTAPGILLKEQGRMIIMLPGPPREMTRVFEEAVLPILKHDNNQLVISRYYNLSDIGESAAEDRLLDLIDTQVNPTIATYAKMGEVLIRITANGNDENEMNALLDHYEEIMLSRFEDNIFSFSKDSLQITVCKLLLEKNITLATAESCTGGLIASQVTEYPGISKIFGTGLVTYSNEAKINLLGIKKETLDTYGAVSNETAIEMCENLQKISQAMLCVSVTGIAGPDGGSAEKPVGLVYIGVCFDGKTDVYHYHFNGDRKVVQQKTANKVFHLIRKTIVDKSK